jgi:prepilin-type processing-associated H-X9-DG protein
MITANILQRVFRILHNNKTGSAYTVEKGEQQYLISAAHVFEGALEVNNVQIFHDGAWKTIEVEVVRNCRQADTIVFRLPFDLSPRLPVNYGTKGIIYGTWGYFLGFPLSVAAPGCLVNHNFPVPLIKAGLISGMNSEIPGINIAYLDGHANRGFSGGPAIWIDSATPAVPQIIGTVTGFVTEYPQHPDTKADIRDFGTNAGIVEAHWIGDFFDFLP